MLNKKSCFIFFVSLIITGLVGCGGGTSNLDVSTSSSGAQLQSISITPADPTLAVDTSQQFTATGIYSDNTTQDLTSSVTWTSSAVYIAAGIDEARFTGLASDSSSFYRAGYITATHWGKAKITGKWGNISGSTDVTVTPATLVSIAITPVNPSVAPGTTQQFTATGTFSDNTTQDLTTAVTWNSSSVAVATISSAAGTNGLATSAAAGSTSITAISGSISGSTTLTVTPATLVSIAITPTNPSIAPGTTQQFTAMGTYSDNTTQNLTTAVTWNSSTGSVASISNAAGSKGLATSVAAGSTTITATSGNISGSTALTVTSATLVSIAVTPANPSIVKGTTRQFTATGTYSDSTTQNLTTAVTWGSSTAGVATISNAAGSKGLATSVAAGSTTITATSGSISGSTTLSVTSATLVSLAVTPATPSIVAGTTQQFIATGTYSDGSTQSLTNAVTWSSSSIGVATISNAAGSNGLATAVVAGSTTITATSGSIAGTATLTVTSSGSGIVTLTWDAPTTNTDGSSLNPVTDLSIYKIYYGTASQTYTQVVNVTNPGTTTVTQTMNLSPGTYYFAVTTVDTSGQESSYSNEIMKTI